MKHKHLKWIGFINGIIIAITVIYAMVVTKPHDIVFDEILFMAMLLVVPAIFSSVISLFEKFNWLYIFGLGYFALSFQILTDPSVPANIIIIFIILPSIILFFIPILDKSIFGDKE